MHSCNMVIVLNLYYSRGIMPKRVSSGGAHLRDLASGQHSSEETSQRWLAVGDTLFDWTDLRIDPQNSRVLSSNVMENHLCGQFKLLAGCDSLLVQAHEFTLALAYSPNLFAMNGVNSDFFLTAFLIR